MPEPVPLSRALPLHSPLRRKPFAVLQDLLSEVTPDTDWFEPVDRLEARCAALLGKPAALFCPTGKIAQMIALRLHAERTGRWEIAAHPKNHLDLWEDRAYSVLHGLRMNTIGDPNAVFTAADIELVGVPLGAVVWELPQREIGGPLPTWEDLQTQIAAARARGAATHLDGARLWEAQTYYERPFAEIAGLFDTVYVSLYKALLAPRGAVLLGDHETIAAARVWNNRMGGFRDDAWPFALAALHNMDKLLPRMTEFRDHARAIAAAINADGVASTVPEVPPTPLFHIHLPVSKAAAEAAGADIRARKGIQVFGRILSQPNPRHCAFELTVGENASEWTPQEVAALIRELVELARQAD